jgi:ubiquitin C-terminal hydrolase
VLADALEGVQTGDGAKTPLMSLFTGRVQDYVRCAVCGNERSQETPFINLSLEVQQRGASSVQEALRRYVMPETLEGPNAVSCASCRANTPSLKGVRIAELPKLLFVHLSRFTYDRASRQRVKINSVMKFPLVLDATEFTQPRQRHAAGDRRELFCIALAAHAQSLEGLIIRHL